MRPYLLILISLCLFENYIDAYNILGIFPHPGKSHFASFAPLFKELALRGHNVTVISHFPSEETIPNYRDVSLAGSLPVLVDAIDVTEVPKTHFAEQIMISSLLMHLSRETCSLLSHPTLQNFLQEDNKYDVVLSEIFNENCFLAFAHKLKAPTMGFISCTVMSWTTEFFGLPDNPSYIPMNFNGFSDRMTFSERLYNFWTYILQIGFVEPLFANLINEYTARKYLGNDLPPLKTIARNTSMILVNTHYSLNLPRPLPPGVVEVGGIHIPKLKKLPKDIQKYLDESTKGVIYFSMGSMIKGSSFPKDKTRAFMEAFAELPQRILWKYENESITDKPKNVKVARWLPQYDILNHPNVVAFISHGGLLGTIEGVYSGVPLISIPMYGDQFTNVQAAVTSGAAVSMKWNDINKKTILQAIKTVLEPSFRENVKRVSDVYRDRPLSPMDTAIYWVEYVARHKGAKFMQSAAVDMNLFQYLLLDVIFFSINVIALFLYVVYKLITRYRRNRSKKEQKSKMN